MGGEIVVEGDRDRKAVAAPAAGDRVLQIGCEHDTVRPGQVVQLPLEQLDSMRSDQFELRCAGALRQGVVDQRDTGATAAQAEDVCGRRGEQQCNASEESPDGRAHVEVVRTALSVESS